ncbi:MAG TPA: hypothetical protein VN968_28545 [Bradyrhizobium sp.]|nr:hypothetical protein [Bradyrhizobium sp.]
MHLTSCPACSKKEHSDAFGALNCPDASENPFIVYRLGQSQTRLGNVDKGVEYLLRAYMLDGEDIFSSDQNGEEFLAILRSRKLV